MPLCSVFPWSLLCGLLGLLILCPLPAAAAPSLPDDAVLARLAGQEGWRRLMHYAPDGASPSGLRSAIVSDEFFLAANGRDDPLAELRATVSAMLLPGPDTDDHAQCRFPARRLWLSRQLGDVFAPRPCPTLDSWRRGGAIRSVSIVLANGFLGNPASYYGHTFLKLNVSPPSVASALQDVTVNYGAIDTERDDPVSYIVKGVLGGYDGGFSEIGYYFHENNYGENELRDLWEYRLDLPQAQVDLIAAHAWEVIRKRYRYYFFRENCAFRMTEIVEVVEGLDLMPRSRPWTVPLSVLQSLAEARFEGRPVLGETIYRPSRQSRFYRNYLALSAVEQGAVRRQVRQDGRDEDGAFAGLPLPSRQAVLDVLIDYYQFIADPAERARGVVSPAYARALASRYALPPGARPRDARTPEPPHAGRAPSWVQLGMQDVRAGRTWGTLRLRPAYYDPLDSDGGHIPNAALSMGDLQLRFRDDAARLQRLDVVAIESAAPGISGLPGDRGHAWKLRFGAEPARLGCDDCVVPRLQGDVGFGRQIATGVFVAGYVGGAFQQARAQQGVAFGRVSADLVVRPWPGLGARVGAEQRFPASSAHGAPHFVGVAELRHGLGRAGDVRLRHEVDGSRATTLGVGWYW